MKSKYPEILFVTGIGTDVGKSHATGWLASKIAESRRKVITQKFIQTGNTGFSEDIDVHRKVMEIPLTQADLDHVTAPIILSYPASPDLAAKIDGVTIDFSIATTATGKLLRDYGYETVVIEGAGGLLVPLRDDYLTADYIAENQLPIVIVTNGALGSINHTLLTLQAASRYGLKVHSIIWNPHFSKDKTVSEDARGYLKRYVAQNLPGTLWLDMDSGSGG